MIALLWELYNGDVILTTPRCASGSPVFSPGATSGRGFMFGGTSGGGVWVGGTSGGGVWDVGGEVPGLDLDTGDC